MAIGSKTPWESREFEPEPLLLPLHIPPTPSLPTQGTDDDGDRNDERDVPGSHVIVIDLA